MATDSQMNANRKNAQHSTGPRTESGKAISARNALTLGLFTKTDFVRPEEQAEYDQLCARCVTELNPEGFLEESFTTAIVSARWRLRRCSLVERQFAREKEDRDDPMYEPILGRYQESVDRARARAFLLLSRATAELRRLQTDRVISKQLLSSAEELPALIGAKQILTAIDQHRRAVNRKAQNSTAEMGSNCNQTPRNARCPCGSGAKFKRCCGKDAPPVLGKVA